MKKLIFILLSAALMVACANERETSNGQKFTILKQGDGKEVDAKKFLILSLVFKDSKDSVWSDTRKNPYPWITMKQAIMRPGDNVLSVISMLTKGDSATFKVSAKDIFSKSFHQPVPPKVDSASFFTFNVCLSNVLDSAEFIKYREELVAKQDEIMRKQAEKQLGIDTVLIDTYTNGKNLVTKKTASGLRYMITKNGVGENVKDGQRVKVNYGGYLLTGKYFDTNIESVAKANNMYRKEAPYQPLEIVVGRGSVISGWDEALKLMNKGCKMTVYIPSTLGYGTQRRGADIVENSILAFDMELVDIVKK